MSLPVGRMFVTSSKEKNLLICIKRSLIGWEQKSKQLAAGDVVFVFNLDKHRFEAGFQVLSNSNNRNPIWLEETQSSRPKIVYNYRWNTRLLCDSLGIEKSTLQKMPPFKNYPDKRRLGILLMGKAPKIIEEPKYNELRDLLVSNCKSLSDLLSSNKYSEMSVDEAYAILKSGDSDLVEKILVDEPQVIDTGEHKTTITQRVGQEAVRRDVLDRYSNKCALCDIAYPSLLVASHIVGWSKDKQNRGNPRNVICMCIAHDKLFEKKLIVMSDNGEVQFTQKFSQLSVYSKMLLAVKDNTERKIRTPKCAEPDPKLLQIHRADD